MTKWMNMFLIFLGSLSMAADNLVSAFSEGKLILNIRFRVELVDQDGAEKDALAPTVRTRLGYKTAELNGWSVLVDFENIAVVGDEKYNNTKNMRTEYPVIADPKDTEVNQIHLTYSGLADNTFVLGRQRIILDNARFVGNVGWRQNEQTYDAVTWKNVALSKTTLTASYLANANRIFGEHHPSRSDIELSALILHAKFAALPVGDLAVFAHLLENEDAQAASHKNIGLRWNGKVKINEAFGLSFDASYVDQSSYQDGEGNDADYLSVVVGPRWQAFGAKLGYEKLGGDGTYGFATPFATLHAFNGWADKFLATPTNGLVDLFGAIDYKTDGWKFMIVYHQFEAEQGSDDYGTELDVLIAKKVNKNIALGVKAADYSADLHSVDTTKIWGWLQWKL